MVDQATVTGNGRTSRAAMSGLRRGIGGLLHDIVTLAELQMTLLQKDAGEGVSRTIKPMAVLATGLALAAIALPILAIAPAYALVEVAGWPRWGACLATAAVLLVIGGLLAVLALGKLRHSFDTLRRSRLEFQKNKEWLKAALKQRELQTSSMRD